MKIAIFGAGTLGKTLGKLWADAGHEIIYTFARSTKSLQETAALTGSQASWSDPRAAIEEADVILLALPWWVLPEAAKILSSSKQQVIIDANNPFKPGWVKFFLPDSQSSGEYVRDLLPRGARLVKAFNVLHAHSLEPHARRSKPHIERSVVCLSGDDVDARSIVATLIADAGYTPLDFGPLENNSYFNLDAPFDVTGPMSVEKAREIMERERQPATFLMI
jgi:hypothetical protein